MNNTVFVIGGMSECGKSTVGKYLDSKGIRRLKIVTYLKKVMEREGGFGDFQEWNDRIEQEKPDWLMTRFVEEFTKAVREEDIGCCCLESLYRPEFGQFIKNNFDGEVVIVYVDIPLEIRLRRQMIRQQLSSIEEAEDYLLPRDEKKAEWGTHRIQNIADVVIDNSGDLQDLYQQVNEIINRYCPNSEN